MTTKVRIFCSSLCMRLPELFLWTHILVFSFTAKLWLCELEAKADKRGAHCRASSADPICPVESGKLNNSTDGKWHLNNTRDYTGYLLQPPNQQHLTRTSRLCVWCQPAWKGPSLELPHARPPDWTNMPVCRGAQRMLGPTCSASPWAKLFHVLKLEQ